MTELFINPINWVNWFAPILIMTLIKPIYKLFIFHTKNLIKAFKLKELRRIKNNRRNAYQIYSQITKSSSYFTLFLCSGLLFYVALLTTPFLIQIKNNMLVILIAMSPVLIFEFLWLQQDGYTKQLIKSASKLKFTSSFKKAN